MEEGALSPQGGGGCSREELVLKGWWEGHPYGTQCRAPHLSRAQRGAPHPHRAQHGAPPSPWTPARSTPSLQSPAQSSPIPALPIPAEPPIPTEPRAKPPIPAEPSTEPPQHKTSGPQDGSWGGWEPGRSVPLRQLQGQEAPGPVLCWVFASQEELQDGGKPGRAHPGITERPC